MGGTPSKHLADSGRKTVLKASAIVKSKGNGGYYLVDDSDDSSKTSTKPERIGIDNHPTDSRAVERGDGPDDEYE